MTRPAADTDTKPGFSVTADKLERLLGTMISGVDRYADLVAGNARLTPADFAATLRHLNERIDDQTSTMSELRVRIHRLTGLAFEVDKHRESVAEMEHNLRTIPRWHWIRRNRIRHQLALIAIAITKRTPKGLTEV